MKLGFIGLGIMGSPMAINLARAGHQLRYDYWSGRGRTALAGGGKC